MLMTTMTLYDIVIVVDVQGVAKKSEPQKFFAVFSAVV